MALLARHALLLKNMQRRIIAASLACNTARHEIVSSAACVASVGFIAPPAQLLACWRMVRGRASVWQHGGSVAAARQHNAGSVALDGSVDGQQLWQLSSNLVGIAPLALIAKIAASPGAGSL